MSLINNEIELIILDESTDSAVAESDESVVFEDFADVEAGVFWGKVTEEEIELERKYKTDCLIEPKPQLVTKRKRTSITGQPKYLPLLPTKSVVTKFINPFRTGHIVKPSNNFVTPRSSPSGRYCPRLSSKSVATIGGHHR